MARSPRASEAARWPRQRRRRNKARAAQGGDRAEGGQTEAEVGLCVVKHPVTPDGHYFVVRGRLSRMANSNLDEVTRDHLVARLMAARRAVRDAKRAADR